MFDDSEWGVPSVDDLRDELRRRTEASSRRRSDRSGDAPQSHCDCTTTVESGEGDDDPTLVVDASDCRGSSPPATADPDGTRPATRAPRGCLWRATGCRATVVAALADREVTTVACRSDGWIETYAGDGLTLLLAAGRFHARVQGYDDRLAARVRRDPVDAARAATGRTGPVGRLLGETGLGPVVGALLDDRQTGDEGDDGGGVGWTAALPPPAEGPTCALGRVRAPPQPVDTVADRHELDTGAVVRRVQNDADTERLHLTPFCVGLTNGARRLLAAAHDRLARGVVDGGGRAAERAVRTVAESEGVATDGGVGSGDTVASAAVAVDPPLDRLADVLDRHTRGLGFLGDLVATPGVTDCLVSAPVVETPVSVRVDGDRAITNVWLTESDARTLASRVRAESGRGLSRASPTADATVDGVRVAAVTDPLSDGPGFALRTAARGDDATGRAGSRTTSRGSAGGATSGDGSRWTLARLVAADTLPPRAAALLSLAVDRGAAGLVAGPRGAGKTTALGALLWELSPDVRTLAVEDTAELPLAALRAAGRDVQRLAVGTDDDAAASPTAAVRTALRLGEGALVVGEVRGREAQALYEAMRVGAAAETVLGTIHGSDAASVYERVVSDLGVAASAFGATDFVCALGADHRLVELAEVRPVEEGDSVTFATLFDRDGATGRVRRGDSRLLATLTHPEDSYGDTLDELAARAECARRLADLGRGETATLRATDATRPDATRPGGRADDPTWSDGGAGDSTRPDEFGTEGDDA
ncbi:ATPase, T2SS/T4P/T4SS family [Halobaculum sp. MBLA0147]|uniref:ATPase, T2SS/T4P/T4SS family n=1 Tax=Halobaculum sp. MBLA0147 TaxID=3079934 RepID=UPI00352650AD